jgi:uncharacterized membrane protein
LGQPPRSARIDSLDLLRGLVMVLMALDHSRAFYGALGNPTDLATTTPALFVTRWATHLCAPSFVALAGLGAALYARRVGVEKASRFLLGRGLWLVFLEVAVVNTCWQLGFSSLSLLVIWALGASMLCLGVLVRLGPWAPLAFGLLVVLGHNLLGGVAPADLGALAIPWGLAMAPHSWKLAGFPIGVSYPFLPWAGLMALGWAAAPWLVGHGGVRLRRAAALGAGLVAAFMLLRGLSLYGDPRPWGVQERGALFTLFSLLDTTKYPPSLQYLLMTIGPALLLLPLLERLRGAARQSLLVFGRVPMFFYLLHIPLLQVGSRGLRLLTGGLDAPVEPSLLRVYAGWAVTLALLYPLCLAWGRLKARHRDWWWLRYL